jgi:glycosyltransferase involved in cell wall biosynthesis
MKACVVIPALNEEDQLEFSARRLLQAMHVSWEGAFELVIADNGSTDATAQIAARLAEDFCEIKLKHISERGRGGALRAAWMESEADILAYMDVDLSTDLAHLTELLNSIASGNYDVAIGSRLLSQSQVSRGLIREVLSRGYNQLLRLSLNLQAHDAQCGFKAISKTAALRLLPLIKDNNWFFDTELLVYAQQEGFRVKEFPVRWTDDPDSRVKILRTVFEDVAGIWRLRRGAVRKEDKSECSGIRG